MKKQILALSVIAGLVAGYASVASATATLNVHGKVLQTTCDVDLTRGQSVELRALETDWATPAAGELASGDFTNNSNNASPSEITISNCRGNPVGITPAITVSGNTIAGSLKLFAESSTAPIAIAVSSKAIAAGNVLSNADFVTSGDAFWTGTASTAAAASGGTTVLPVYVGLVQSSASAPVAGDEVRAVINFSYDEK